MKTDLVHKFTSSVAAIAFVANIYVGSALASDCEEINYRVLVGEISKKTPDELDPLPRMTWNDKEAVLTSLKGRQEKELLMVKGDFRKIVNSLKIQDDAEAKELIEKYKSGPYAVVVQSVLKAFEPGMEYTVEDIENYSRGMNDHIDLISLGVLNEKIQMLDNAVCDRPKDGFIYTRLEP